MKRRSCASSKRADPGSRARGAPGLESPPGAWTALPGVICGLGGAGLNLALFVGPGDLRPSSLTGIVCCAAAACGWGATALGWSALGPRRFGALRPLLAPRPAAWIALGLGLACLSPLLGRFFLALTSPQSIFALARTGWLTAAALQPLGLFCSAYALAGLDPLPWPRLNAWLRPASRLALMVLVLFGLPGAGRMVHLGLGADPLARTRQALEFAAREAQLRSRSNAVICAADPDSPHCARPLRSCAEALGLARSPVPAGTRALRNPLPDGLEGVPCVLLDQDSGISTPFRAYFVP